jgi:hypothetical protein
MKALLKTTFLAALLAVGTILSAQEYPEEYLGLPGDNLNLYAVLNLFQQSKTLEAFEKSLNDENTHINNLDLNGDNYVDYLMVIDNVDGNVHNIVLRDAISQRESQDVAVITVQRFPDGEVQIQLTGDDALYGKDYIIEPIYDENQGQTPNPGYTGNTTVVYGRNVTVIRTTPYVVAMWPVVRFIYRPGYVVWHSRWYWGYYPAYWHPWKPFYWHYYYGYHYDLYNVYYAHYRPWRTHRYSHWNDYYYTARRVYSPVVRTNMKSGIYRSTYSHPEQRKEGEVFYSRNHPASSRGRRVAASTTTNNTSRNAGNVSSRERRNTVTTTRTVTNRRTVSTTDNRGNNDNKTGRTNVSSRRSVNPSSNNQAVRSNRDQSVNKEKTTRQSRVSPNSRSNRSEGNNKTGTRTKKNDKKQKNVFKSWN